MKKLRILSLMLVMLTMSTGLILGNNDCKSSQYGQGKAAVQTNCVVSSTGFQLFGSVLWWGTFEDGMAMCCVSVMDCNKTCDQTNETVCHPV